MWKRLAWVLLKGVGWLVLLAVCIPIGLVLGFFVVVSGSAVMGRK
jgi:hypothetical protein